ncbi:MAG: hypothetical protein WAX44_03855 [Minisyncoccia bacterium]
MKIVTVIPISKGIHKETLTYFTKSDLFVGSVVSIPLRGRKIVGLVSETRKAEDLKAELKSLPYNIKKIENIKAVSFLSKSFISSCQKASDYYAGSLGSVLFSLIPKTILDNCQKISFEEKERNGPFHETLLLQANDEERYAIYKSLIREEFAKNKSLFFCLPNTEDILNAKMVLEKGIERYTYAIHSNLSTQEILNLWKEITENDHPVLIIGTGQFLSIPRNDLCTIIVDKESSRAYKMLTRPYLDIRHFAEILSKESSIKLILGDILLRVETIWQEKNPGGNYSELSPLKFRSLSTSLGEIINMKAPQDMKKKEFTIFSDKLKKLIIKNKESNEHLFLFCGRKGLYPQTICSDCGTVVVCNNCLAPVVLYGKPTNTKPGKNTESKNLFVCHHCGERRGADELCKHCGGWRLNPFGIGIERVEEEVKNLIPDAKIIIIDKDHIKTHKQAVKAREVFFGAPGSIMLGTEMALTYLNQKIENSAVASIDSYFSIPDYQINERVFHIFLELRSKTLKNIIIQTRQENTRIFDYALKGNLADFYREEIEERKSIGYPPFTTYIKLSLVGEKNIVKEKMAEVAKLFLPYSLQIYDAWNPGNSKKHTIHGLIGIPRKNWVDTALLSKLKSLSPQFMIKIDPSTLL